MKVAEIKRLAREYSISSLKMMEEEILEGLPPHLPVEGEDEGDKLTNITGAIWVKEQMDLNKSDLNTEVRNFSQRVRKSIN